MVSNNVYFNEYWIEDDLGYLTWRNGSENYSGQQKKNCFFTKIK